MRPLKREEKRSLNVGRGVLRFLNTKKGNVNAKGESNFEKKQCEKGDWQH